MRPDTSSHACGDGNTKAQAPTTENAESPQESAPAVRRRDRKADPYNSVSENE